MCPGCSGLGSPTPALGAARCPVALQHSRAGGSRGSGLPWARWPRLLPDTPAPRPAVTARQLPHHLPGRGQPRSDTAHRHPRLHTPGPGPAGRESPGGRAARPGPALTARRCRLGPWPAVPLHPRSTIWRAAAPQWSSGNRGELHIHGRGWAGGARTGPPLPGRPAPSSASFTAGARRRPGPVAAFSALPTPPALPPLALHILFAFLSRSRDAAPRPAGLRPHHGHSPFTVLPGWGRLSCARRGSGRTSGGIPSWKA